MQMTVQDKQTCI